jgi:nitroreductase
VNPARGALGADEVLTTTRAVRRRLDLTRPVDPALVRECVAIALQAPTGGNDQPWQFVVVTDAQTRAAIGETFRSAAIDYAQAPKPQRRRRELNDDEKAARKRVMSSAGYLFEHLSEVPVLVIPCIDGRYDGAPIVDLATAFGSILPAVWSFMLAARSRGLGTAWTTAHLAREAEIAGILGIPYAEVTQVALIPVAHTIGDTFNPGARRPVEDMIRWERWDRQDGADHWPDDREGAAESTRQAGDGAEPWPDGREGAAESTRQAGGIDGAAHA